MIFPRDRSLQLLLAIMAAVFVWGSVHALGTYLYANHDVRKPLIVYAVLVAFLGGWAVLLWLRNRRKKP